MASRKWSSKRREDRIGHNLDPANVPFNAELALDVVDHPTRLGEKSEVTRTLRNDPLAGLAARGHIDKAQFTAGRRWQAYWQTAQGAGVIAMDPMKEPVDGHGPTRTSFSDDQLDAFAALAEARRALGHEGDMIVRDVLSEGLSIVDVAHRRGGGTKSQVRYFGIRFRECLESLAVLWGLAAVVHKSTGQRTASAKC